MRTTVRKIGNSHGILIPAPLLAECGITNAWGDLSPDLDSGDWEW